MRKEIIVTAFWDQEAQVWVAEGVNYPGIVAESTTMEHLIEKLKVIIPEITEQNDGRSDEISFRLLSEVSAIARIAPPHA